MWSLHSASVEAKQHPVHCTDLHAVLVDIGTVLFVVVVVVVELQSVVRFRSILAHVRDRSLIWEVQHV